MSSLASASSVAALLLASMAAPVGDGGMTYLESGAAAKARGYMPQKTTLSETKPESITKLPEGLTAPLYGILDIPGATGRTFHVIVDEPAGAPAKLYVDGNGDGDLTNDEAAEWAGKAAPGADGKEYTTYNGGFVLTLGPKGSDAPLRGRINAYRFDKTDPRREANKMALLFYRDYGAVGTLTVGEKQYQAMIDDAMTSGDLSGASRRSGGAKAEDAAKPAEKAPEKAQVRLLIDVNGNGKFDQRGESFAVNEPFNIGGTTWELASLDQSGAGAKVVKSSKEVAEVLPPPDLSVGKSVLAFDAKAMDGAEVHFPKDYKGKIVLLDFWATWCGPCMAEMPNVVAAYEKFHGQGLEILAVTLDNPGAEEKIQSTMEKAKMTWAQIYDGGGWKASIAQQYGIFSIPQAFLVDGDTGAILATGNDVRGEALAASIEKALAAKNKG